MAISRKAAIGATSGAVLAAAAAFITPWEGIYTHVYLDIVGVPTWCIGETAADGDPVPPSDKRFTVAECKALLIRRLPKYDDGIKRCIHREMPDSVHVALISAAYNLGVNAVCKGSIARRANTGDWRGACDALLLYNRAGGRVIRGLVNRRKAERERCLKGLR